MAHKTLTDWLADYDPDGTRTTRVKIERHTNDNPSKFFLIEDPEGRVAIINPMAFGDYLDIDVHGFHADGTDAAIGAHGMSSDVGSLSFPKADTPHRGHGWPAAHLIALFID